MGIGGIVSALTAISAMVVLFNNLTAVAAVRGVLIGVADYGAGGARLEGPPNDIVLMHRMLSDRGVTPEDITVLADRLPADAGAVMASASPTKGNIVAALARAANQARPGDTLVLYFSGHGSQQPARPGDPDEPDGLDEIFLPVDAGAADPATGMVADALTDNEIGQAVDGIRAKGALVWAIFDSCNSGTLTRQGGTDGGLRMIPAPLSGGRPQHALGGPSDPIVETELERPGQGGYVGFFAARSDQPTWEQPLPPEADENSRRVHGPLTFVLTRALARRPAQSYRELSVAIFDGYDRLRVQGRRPVPVPYFDGDLDRPVFGAESARGRGVPVERLDEARALLHAGMIDGVANGMAVRLRPVIPEAGTAQLTATVEKAGATRSVLAIGGPVPPSFPFTLVADLPEVPARRRFRLSAPVAAADDEAYLLPAQAAFERVTRDGTEDRGFVFVGLPAGDPSADIALRVEGRNIVLLPSSMTWKPPPSQGPDRRRFKTATLEGGAEAAATALVRSAIELAQGLNVLDIAARMVEHSNVRINVQAFRLPAGQAPSVVPPDAYRCAQTPGDRLPPGAQPLDDSDLPAFRHCDALYLQLRNEDRWPVDLSAFYIDSLGCAVPLLSTGRGFRLEPGKTRILKVTVNTWSASRGGPSTTGIERLVLLGSARQSPLEDAVAYSFVGLVPRCNEAGNLPPADAANRGSVTGFRRMMLEAAGYAPVTRSGLVVPLEEKIFAHIARLRLLPPGAGE